jgi:hypothetical protein
MTPDGVLDMHNKNTGDLLGDTSFVISKRTSAYACRTTEKGSPFCQDVTQFSGDDANSTDLIIAFTIEVDGEWGPYLPCNPDNSSLPRGGWHCNPDIIAPPKDWPKQCKTDHEQAFDGSCMSNKPLKVTNGISLGDCCDKLEKSFVAQSFSYHKNNQSCELHGFSFDFKTCPNGLTAFKPHGKTKPECNCTRVHKTVGRQNLTSAYGNHSSKYGPSYKGGTWYSHPSEGECKKGQSLGDGGCTWRVIEAQKTINASCMYGHIDGAVEQQGSACFSTCSQPHNVTSDCYLKCYTETTDKMTTDTLTHPWSQAFSSVDPESGGCPAVAGLQWLQGL